jgi:hypothetical protein
MLEKSLFPPGESYNTFVELREASGTLGGVGTAAVWFRLTQPLLEGVAPDQVAAMATVCVAADSANGISSVLNWAKYRFVNSDLNVNLIRSPVVNSQGELWLCLDSVTLWDKTSSNGLSRSNLFDEKGLIGHSTQSLIARRV